VATVTGFGVIALGALVLLGLPGLAAAPTFLVAFAVMGAGLGVASVTSTHVGTSAAEAAHEEHEGVVLGVLTSAAQVGSTIGLALLLPLAHWVGYAWGFAGAAVVAALGTSSALLLPGRSASATDHGRAQDGQRDLLRHPAG
jgi:MFS family permease